MTNHELLAKETLIIDGMRCAACAASIGKALQKTSGVQEAVINFAA